MDVDIDVNPLKRDRILKALELYYRKLGGEVRQICTYSTEGTKRSIVTACNGLGLGKEVGPYIASLVPIERGFNLTFKQCYYGDDDHNPVNDFVKEVDQYEGLAEIIQAIEGLICGRSRHACFVAGTTITMKNSFKPIEEVKVGDYVLTHLNNYRKVVKTHENLSEQIITIKTKNASVRCTPNHPMLVYSENKYSWKEACKISLSEDFLVSEYNKLEKIESISVRQEETRVYNLTVEEDNSYCAEGYKVHNCGIAISHKKFWEHNATMKTPGGELVSQFNLSESEEMSAVKMDLLSVDVLARQQTCLNLLKEYGHIKPLGSLKEEYFAYLHEKKIDVNDEQSWTHIQHNEVPYLFQMTEESGKKGIRMGQPSSLLELASINSLIRLQKEKGAKESPLETYARYKRDLSEWYKDMSNFGLNTEQQRFFAKYIGGEKYGLAETQEDLMKIIMGLGQDLSFGHKIRKVVAKFLASTIAI